MPKLSPEAIEAFDLRDTFVPAHLRDGLRAYIESGRPQGSFVEAVLCNDLKNAAFRASIGSAESLVTIVRWLWNFAPIGCHGSEARVRGWMDARQRDLEAVK